MSFSINYWTTRYKAFGHTGWKSPLIYAYDQLERLAIISEKISASNVPIYNALDFGCGTGDFTKLLLKNGAKVWSYDPNVKPDIHHENMVYIESHSSLMSLKEQMDLILSVTVLDHILDDEEFLQELINLRQIISNLGQLWMLEYALDETTKTNNAYQAFRKVDVWEKQLSKSGWEILSIEPVPHPGNAPSLGFQHYRRRIPVTLIGKFTKFRIFQTWSLSILNRYAEKSFKKFGLGSVASSPLKLICCQPK